jgi:hypothetical protein
LEAKQNNYNNQILRSNNKIKTTWEIVKVESGKRVKKNNNMDIQEINLDGDSTDNPQVTASVFNEYFLSVAEKTLPQDNNINSNKSSGINDIKSKHSNTSNSNPAHYLAHAFNNPFLNIQLKFSTTKKLKTSLNPLNLKIHMDVVKYPLNYLKLALLILPHLLNHIYNTSFLSGTFPQCLKYSIVKLLFKKVDRTDISNYRPVSILTSF